MEELMLPLVHKKKKKMKPVDDVSEKKRESGHESEKNKTKPTKTPKQVASEKIATKTRSAVVTPTAVEPKKKEKLARPGKPLSRKKKVQPVRDEHTREKKQENISPDTVSVIAAPPNQETPKGNEEIPVSAKIAEEKILSEPEPILAEPVNAEASMHSGMVENLPMLELPQEQIDRIHRGRKTTLLTKARKECDWVIGDRIRLPDGTILKILRKEKITMGLNMPEDLVESEGFSSDNRAEFARHLQRLGLRANEAAFLYRIELS